MKEREGEGSTGFRDNLHVLHGDVLQDLAVVHVPHGLVVPDFGGQQDGAQDDPLPVARADVHLSVRQQPLQVNLAHADGVGESVSE